MALQNIPTLVIFPILILSDGIWNVKKECAVPISIIASFTVGGLVGIGWSAFIDSTKLTKLQYFNGLSNKETCSVSSKQRFKCTVKGTAEKKTAVKKTAVKKT